MKQNRLRKLVNQMNIKKLETLVIITQENLDYLFGFKLNSGKRLTACVINKHGEVIFFINSIYERNTLEQLKYPIKFYHDGEDPIALILNEISFKQHVGVDRNFKYFSINSILERRKDLTLVLSDCVESLREIKDQSEINALYQSAIITDAVVQQVAQLQTHPTSEGEIAKMVASFFDNYNIDELTFNPIIATGINAVNPHHQAGDDIVGQNDLLLIDIGAKYKGYCSDMTRMYANGGISHELSTLYDHLLEAQQMAIDMIRPGIELREIDLTIRNYLKRYHLEDYFIHATGHGIGLEATELPYINHRNTDIVKEGMVVTIGPGLYLQDKYGLRIEDVVCVTKTGSQSLNRLSKDLLILEEESI